MANSLFLYKGEDAKRVACMMSSIVCMGRYASLAATVNMKSYGRLVFVLEENEVAALATYAMPEDHPKWLGLVVVGSHAEYMMNIPNLGDFSFTAFVDKTVLEQEAIVAAEGMTRAIKLPHKNDPEVLQAMETFLHAHNTCALATGWGENVHSTPIEYIYHQGKLYMFSEGGRKFAYLYRNRYASVSIFDPFTDFQTIGGLQIDGTARFIEPEDEEYAGIAAARGLTLEKINKMAVMLHVIEITPHKARFLWGGFMKEHKAPSQIYVFA